MSRILLTPQQAAERTRLAASTLAKMRVTGGGPPFVKLGARVFYVGAELDDWIADLKVFRSTADVAESQRRPKAGRKRKETADMAG